MKLLIDDTTGRTHNLNANEACVYAAILKCTKAGRGWFAPMQALSEALPYVVDRKTVSRAIQKLVTIGLIERRDNALFACGQNDQSSGQNDRSNDQFDHLNGQNDRECTSPYNPLIINNENMDENKNATCTHTCDTRTPDLPTFLDLKKEFSSKGGGGMTTHMEMQAAEEWNHCSDAKKVKLLEAVRLGAHFKPRLDWLIADFPEPKPRILSGFDQELMWRNGQVPVLVKYEDKFVAVTEQESKLFGLDIVRKIYPVNDCY